MTESVKLIYREKEYQLPLIEGTEGGKGHRHFKTAAGNRVDNP